MVFMAVGSLRGPRRVAMRFEVMDFWRVSHSEATEEMVGEVG